jgi:hypothetical protein
MRYSFGGDHVTPTTPHQRGSTPLETRNLRNKAQGSRALGVERLEIASSMKVIWFFAVKVELQISSERLFGKKVLAATPI